MITNYQGVHRSYTIDDLYAMSSRTTDPEIRGLIGEFQVLSQMHGVTQRFGVFAGKPNPAIGRMFPRLAALNLPDQLSRMQEELDKERREAEKCAASLKSTLREVVNEAIEDANLYNQALDEAYQIVTDQMIHIEKLYTINTALYLTLTLYVIALIAFAH